MNLQDGKRIVVTGCGFVSAADSADSSADLLELIEAGAGNGSHPGQPRRVSALCAERYLTPAALRRTDRFCRMAMVASLRSLEMAGLRNGQPLCERTGVVLNTCFGSMTTTETYMTKVIRGGPKRAPAGLFPYTVHNAATGVVTMNVKALGTNSTVSGCNPVCYGVDMIRQGTDDRMIVGGCEELAPSIVSGFAAERSAGDGTDAAGDQPMLGEGAAVVVLEDLDAVAGRGGTALAEVLDYGLAQSLPAHTSPFRIGADYMERAMRQALERSGVEGGEIDLVIPASNGSAALGDAERDALARVFGHPARFQALDGKAVIGETLGASSTFSLVLAVGALSRGRAARGWRQALVNGCEMGGNVSSVVVKRFR